MNNFSRKEIMWLMALVDFNTKVPNGIDRYQLLQKLQDMLEVSKKPSV